VMHVMLDHGPKPRSKFHTDLDKKP
jgi:hypothetical protein